MTRLDLFFDLYVGRDPLGCRWSSCWNQRRCCLEPGPAMHLTCSPVRSPIHPHPHVCCRDMRETSGDRPVNILRQGKIRVMLGVSLSGDVWR